MPLVLLVLTVLVMVAIAMAGAALMTNSGKVLGKILCVIDISYAIASSTELENRSISSYMA